MKRIRKQGGFIVSIELLFILAFVVMGTIVGWGALKDSVVNELNDVAAAVDSLNQTYAFSGLTGHGGFIVGSAWTDDTDFCDLADNFFDETGTHGRCVVLVPSESETP
jgi:hypothetical protein